MSRGNKDSVSKMKKNKAMCRLCEDIIESKFRHDFVSCKCGEIFVDGGDDYWRAGAKNMSNFIRINEEKEINNMIKQYDLVKTLVDREDVPRGSIGTVVEVYTATGIEDGYEVEVLNPDGSTLGLNTYTSDELYWVVGG